MNAEGFGAALGVGCQLSRGIYLGAYASTQDEENYVLAWEVYWLLPWPIPGKRPTTISTLQRHMLKRTSGFWKSILGHVEAEGGSIESRVTVMGLEISSRRLSNHAVRIRHRTPRGKRKPKMTWKVVEMAFPGFLDVDPPLPLGYRNWRGSWPLGASMSIDHDPFAQMQNKRPLTGRTVRMDLNAMFRKGTRIRYRTSASGKGRHLILRFPRSLRPLTRLDFREELFDDGARVFLDTERFHQLRDEPAHKLRPSGTLWDRKRPFDLSTLRLGKEAFAGNWFAWRTRGGLKRRKR